MRPLDHFSTQEAVADGLRGSQHPAATRWSPSMWRMQHASLVKSMHAYDRVAAMFHNDSTGCMSHGPLTPLSVSLSTMNASLRMATVPRKKQQAGSCERRQGEREQRDPSLPAELLGPARRQVGRKFSTSGLQQSNRQTSACNTTDLSDLIWPNHAASAPTNGCLERLNTVGVSFSIIKRADSGEAEANAGVNRTDVTL